MKETRRADLLRRNRDLSGIVANERVSSPLTGATTRLRQCFPYETPEQRRAQMHLVARNDTPVSVFESERFKEAYARMQQSQAELAETLAHLNDD